MYIVQYTLASDSLGPIILVVGRSASPLYMRKLVEGCYLGKNV
jgi:hypothetical protein